MSGAEIMGIVLGGVSIITLIVVLVLLRRVYQITKRE